MATALITGASRGLGAVFVKFFWEAGFDLVLVARDKQAMTSVVARLPERNKQTAQVIECDLGSVDELARLLDSLGKGDLAIDVLINNAATQGPIGVSWDCDASAWQAAIQVNLLTVVALCRAVVPGMRTRSRGAIINLSGGGATGPRANFSAYATAKTGVVRFSETLAEELRGSAVTVNCIAPGAMKTDMLAQVLASGAKEAGGKEYAVAQRVFEEGGASMDRVAELALLLASRDGAGITGKLISAVWDNWEQWPEHTQELANSDAYTLRRIAGRDRGLTWGDK